MLRASTMTLNLVLWFGAMAVASEPLEAVVTAHETLAAGDRVKLTKSVLIYLSDSQGEAQAKFAGGELQYKIHSNLEAVPAQHQIELRLTREVGGDQEILISPKVVTLTGKPAFIAIEKPPRGKIEISVQINQLSIKD